MGSDPKVKITHLYSCLWVCVWDANKPNDSLIKTSVIHKHRDVQCHLERVRIMADGHFSGFLKASFKLSTGFKRVMASVEWYTASALVL